MLVSFTCSFLEMHLSRLCTETKWQNAVLFFWLSIQPQLDQFGQMTQNQFVLVYNNNAAFEKQNVVAKNKNEISWPF